MRLPYPSCPICTEKTTINYVERSASYLIFHCRQCDLVFSDPMRSGVAEWYDKSYSIRHLAVDDRLMWYFSWALQQLPAKGTLLDIACGTGSFVFYARQRGFDAYGIDFSQEAVAAGRRRFNLDTIFATSLEGFQEQRPGERFDAVTLFEVIEHVESPLSFLNHIRDTIKPGGYLIFSVPNRDRWPIRDFADYPPNHLTRWSLLSMRRLLELAGFDVLQLRVTPVSMSINFFFGYFCRVAFYKVMKLHQEGLSDREDQSRAPLAGYQDSFGLLLSTLRRWRDAMMWVPTWLLFPVLYPFFDGYNVIGVVRVKGVER